MSAMTHLPCSGFLRRTLVVAGAGVWLAGVALASSTYEVNVESELNGLDVKIATVENPGGMIVKLTNDSAQKVRCDLRYDASPQPIGRRTVYVDPGKTEQSVFGAKRQWFRVDVKVVCKAVTT
jgi:hypothetical protein